MLKYIVEVPATRNLSALDFVCSSEKGKCLPVSGSFHRCACVSLGGGEGGGGGVFLSGPMFWQGLD